MWRLQQWGRRRDVQISKVRALNGVQVGAWGTRRDSLVLNCDHVHQAPDVTGLVLGDHEPLLVSVENLGDATCSQHFRVIGVILLNTTGMIPLILNQTLALLFDQ